MPFVVYSLVVFALAYGAGRMSGARKRGLMQLAWHRAEAEALTQKQSAFANKLEAEMHAKAAASYKLQRDNLVTAIQAGIVQRPHWTHGQELGRN